MALIGGGNIMCNPRVPLALSAMRLLSSDGRSKAFDKSGDGYARAEGGGMLLLKRLDHALRDGDRVHAVLRGSAVNSDGRASVPIVAPDIRSQMALLTRAYHQAGIAPDTVEYVEAHGTGTALGDAVEANALFNFFLNQGKFIKYGERAESVTDPTARHVRIGSIKSNIGHLEAGAGSLGLIKAILCLKHKTLVRSLHFESFHTAFNGDANRLRVQQSIEAWKHDDRNGSVPLRVAGVSSFGYGGTNAHVVVQEYEPTHFLKSEYEEEKKLVVTSSSSAEVTTPLLLLLSGHSLPSVKQLAASYSSMLLNIGSDVLAAHQLCASASSGRGLLGFRLTGVARTPAALAAALSAFADHSADDGERAAAAVTQRVAPAPAECRLRFQRVVKGSSTFVSVGPSAYGADPSLHARKVVFVFAGQGSQWRAGVPASLLAQFPVFAATLQRMDAFCSAAWGWSLLDFMIIPVGMNAAIHKERRLEMEKKDGAVGGVAIFAAETALALQLKAWGIVADLSLSHSLGEFAASFYSGALSLHECIRMVHTISKLVGARAPRGFLVDCRIGAVEIQQIIEKNGLQKKVYIAAKNAPYSVTLAGTDEGLESLQSCVRISHGSAKAARLLQRVASASAIPYHSPLLDEVPGLRDEVIAALDAILSGAAPKIGVGVADLHLDSSHSHGQVTSAGVHVGEQARSSVRNGVRWWRNIAERVDFIASVEHAAALLKGAPAVHILDLSPTPVLAANVQAILESAGTPSSSEEEKKSAVSHSAVQLNMDDVSVWPVLARPDAALFDLQILEAVATLLLNGSTTFPWAAEYARLTGVNSVAHARRQLGAVKLPQLPTQRQPFWSETLDSFRSRMMVYKNPDAPPALSVLNGLFALLPFSAMDSHDASLTAVYTATVKPMQWPLILAHVFQDSALLPASFSVELFTAIGHHIAENHPFVVEDCHWEKALWMELQEQMTYQLRVEVKPLDEASFSLQLLARQVSNDKYASPAPLQRHVRGIIRMLDPASLPPTPLMSPTLRNAMTTWDAAGGKGFSASDPKYPLVWTHDSWYSSFREAGFAYGPCFTLVDGVCANRKEQTAMVRVVIPSDVAADAAKQNYMLHPGVIDAVTQGKLMQSTITHTASSI
jgi:acyl transferase domain-containing protein